MHLAETLGKHFRIRQVRDTSKGSLVKEASCHESETLGRAGSSRVGVDRIESQPREPRGNRHEGGKERGCR